MLEYCQVKKMGSEMIALINLYSNANLKPEEGEEEMLSDHEPLDKILRFTGLTMAQLNASKSETAGR